ncbi:MAG: Lrp/AsnC family transcriptional regulator [Halobacteriota archaeon]
MELDSTDLAILRILQRDARTPFSEIARHIDMSNATVHDRVGRMEEAGIIKGYHASVDPGGLGLGASAFIGLRVQQGKANDALAQLESIDRVREVHVTTGEWDVLLRVYADDTDDLRELVFEHLSSLDGFSRSQTMVILGTHSERTGLPIPSPDDD